MGKRRHASPGMARILPPSRRHTIPMGRLFRLHFRRVTMLTRREAGAALLTMCQTMLSPEATQIGSYRGLTLELAFDTFARGIPLDHDRAAPPHGHAGNRCVWQFAAHGQCAGGTAHQGANLSGAAFQSANAVGNRKGRGTKAVSPAKRNLRPKTARLEELNTLLNLDHKEPEIVDAEPDEDQVPPERRRPQLER